MDSCEGSQGTAFTRYMADTAPGVGRQPDDLPAAGGLSWTGGHPARGGLDPHHERAAGSIRGHPCCSIRDVLAEGDALRHLHPAAARCATRSPRAAGRGGLDHCGTSSYRDSGVEAACSGRAANSLPTGSLSGLIHFSAGPDEVDQQEHHRWRGPSCSYVRDVPIMWLRRSFFTDVSRAGGTAGFSCPSSVSRDSGAADRGYQRHIQNFGYYYFAIAITSICVSRRTGLRPQRAIWGRDQYKWLDRFVQGRFSFTRTAGARPQRARPAVSPGSTTRASTRGRSSTPASTTPPAGSVVSRKQSRPYLRRPGAAGGRMRALNKQSRGAA